MVSPKYFRRDRVLTFSSIMAMFINRIVKGISIELCNFLNGIKSDLTCTKQAFSKARKKFRHTAFIELNEAFALSFYEGGAFLPFEGGYRLLAVDGSLCQLPESEDIAESFGRWKNQTAKGMPMGRASLVYDVVNRVAINGKLEGIDRCETDIFREQYREVASVGSHGVRDIYLMDRGYPSHDLCSMLAGGGDFFVIRCKKDFNAALSSFVSSGKQMDAIELRGSTWYTKDGEKKGSRYSAPITVTAVRVELPGGQPEYLITNLEGKDIDYFKRLYGMRWGVETYYDYLKHAMELENFSSKTAEGVKQDFHSSLLAGNLVHMLIEEAQRELDSDGGSVEGKHRYQINRSTATGILRGQVIDILFNEVDIPGRLGQLKKQIKTSKTAIVPGRKFERKKTKRSKRKHHMSKKKPL